MEEIDNLLNDDQFVDLINDLSESIYQYGSQTKKNYKEIHNKFELMNDELKENDIISDLIILSKTNENNLDNFFLFAKPLFTELSSTRKEYLNNISYYIKSMNSEKRNKYGHRRAYSSDKINIKNNFEDILNRLYEFSQIIGNYSDQYKQQYINLIKILFQDYKDLEFRNFNKNNKIQSLNNNENVEYYKLEIEKYKQKISQIQDYYNQLENKIKIIKNHNIQGNERIINNQNLVKELNEEIKIQKYNNIEKDKIIKRLKIRNNALYLKYKEKDVEINSQNNNIQSLMEKNEYYKFKFIEENKKNIENKNIINNLKQKINNNNIKEPNKEEEKKNFEEISKLKEEIDIKNNQISIFKNQLEKKEKEDKLKIDEFMKLKNEYEQLKKIKEENDIYLKNILNKKNDNEQNILLINKLRSDNEQKIKQINKLENEINERNNELNKNKSLLIEKETKINEYKLNNDENQSKILEDKKLIDDLKGEKNNLSKSLESKENELNKLIRQLKEKEKEYDLVMKDNNNLKENNNKINEENKNLKERIKKNLIDLEEEKLKNGNGVNLENLENIEKLNLQSSIINNYINEINKKDEIIKKLSSNISDKGTKEQYENDINKLKEENRILIQQNKDLKLSQQAFLLQSVNQISSSINPMENFEQENQSLNYSNEIKQQININEEENRNDIEYLNKRIKDLENENKLLKFQKDNQLNEKSKCLTQSNNISIEQEFDFNDLAKNAKEQNNSEDMKIDFPGLNDINDKYEKLKNKMNELKKLIKEIIPEIQSEFPNIQKKAERICQILEIEI